MEEPDVMSWLIEETVNAEPSKRKEAEELLEADSRLIVLAGRSVYHLTWKIVPLILETVTLRLQHSPLHSITSLKILLKWRSSGRNCSLCPERMVNSAAVISRVLTT
jgi:hypothetical protein